MEKIGGAVRRGHSDLHISSHYSTAGLGNFFFREEILDFTGSNIWISNYPGTPQLGGLRALMEKY